MVKTSVSSSNEKRDPAKVRLKGAPYMRSKASIKRVNMYKGGKPVRNSKGKIIKEAQFQKKIAPGTMARVEPAQRWFGNVKVITQKALQTFQTEMKKVISDPYQVIMKRTILPISLLNEKAKNARVHILDTEPYSSVFGKKSTRKRPNLKVTDFAEYAKVAAESASNYDADKDIDIEREAPDNKELPPLWFLKIGQSRRIWNELYKVIDSSDVVIQVLDSRDPMRTRSTLVEKYLRTEKPHKHLIFILNKVDLVPVWVTQKWKAILSREYPTLAFHASMNHSFGKGDLITLLRQFGKLHQDKKQISIGLIGYPNVGKSSIINTIRGKKVCKVAPIPGETKVWQYISLMRKINLIDCPGIVPPSHESPTDMVLKGSVRTEYLETPLDYIPEIMSRIRHKYLRRTYQIMEWTTPENFVELLACRTGKLRKGGEPDVTAASKMIINDWQRGKLPYFTPPPSHDSSEYAMVKAIENAKTDMHIAEEARLEEEELKKVGRFPKKDDEPRRNVEKHIRGVRQNYRGINLTLEFDDDDIHPLEDNLDETIAEEEDVMDVNVSKDDETTNIVEQLPLSSDASTAVEVDALIGEDQLSSDEDLAPKEVVIEHTRKVRRKKKLLKGEDKPATTMKSKEKRRIDRQKKIKKIGVHFYDEVDTKNRRL